MTNSLSRSFTTLLLTRVTVLIEATVNHLFLVQADSSQLPGPPSPRLTELISDLQPKIATAKSVFSSSYRIIW